MQESGQVSARIHTRCDSLLTHGHLCVSPVDRIKTGVRERGGGEGDQALQNILGE